IRTLEVFDHIGARRSSGGPRRAAAARNGRPGGAGGAGGPDDCLTHLTSGVRGSSPPSNVFARGVRGSLPPSNGGKDPLTPLAGRLTGREVWRSAVRWRSLTGTGGAIRIVR